MKMKKFELNGQTYEAAPINFNTICDLEDFNVSLEDLEKKKMAALRAYAAISIGCDLKIAGKLIKNNFGMQIREL